MFKFLSILLLSYTGHSYAHTDESRIEINPPKKIYFFVQFIQFDIILNKPNTEDCPNYAVSSTVTYKKSINKANMCTKLKATYVSSENCKLLFPPICRSKNLY